MSDGIGRIREEFIPELRCSVGHELVGGVEASRNWRRVRVIRVVRGGWIV